MKCKWAKWTGHKKTGGGSGATGELDHAVTQLQAFGPCRNVILQLQGLPVFQEKPEVCVCVYTRQRFPDFKTQKVKHIYGPALVQWATSLQTLIQITFKCVLSFLPYVMDCHLINVEWFAFL